MQRFAFLASTALAAGPLFPGTHGLTLNKKVDMGFGPELNGSAWAQEIRFPLGDSTTDIWH